MQKTVSTEPPIPAEKPIAPDVVVESGRQQALLKTGALQDAIFNSAYFSSIATDEKGVIQIFNVGAERMLGYAAADVLNKVTPADISDPQEVIARAAALSLELATPITPGFEALVFKASRGIEDIYELTYFRKDGSRFPAIVSVTALRDAQDTIIGYLLIGTDNTARKEVEAAQALLDQRLRDQQFYNRSLIESNIDALMTTDPQGIISDVNQQMIALTGRTRDELIGAPCKNFFTDPGRADAAIKRVLTENKVRNYELTVRALNGDETVVSYNAATFHNRDRKLQGVFAAARDMTELKQFERALQEKNVELEHASLMKSEFLATMSHELRTPLNAIIGFSEALRDGLVGQVSDAQREHINDIFTSGEHLLSLINDILDLSKIEAGMMSLELDAIDLTALLTNSLTIVREKAAGQNIALELQAQPDLGVLSLDIRKTKQIVYNLLSNAVKFSPRGGKVTVKVRRVPRSAVGSLAVEWPAHGFPLAQSEFSEFIEISVWDLGLGISEANLGRLFQAFSQIDSSLARRFEGTGLGLAMVKLLAELHGGTVAVASAESVGSCFATWLPARLGEAGASSSVQRRDPVAKERTALVVEDDNRAAGHIRLLLEAEGFSVLRASSGEEALLLVAQQALSLITLDLRLPGMNGWEFLLRLRDGSDHARIPVVVVSASPERSLALAEGASALLRKPLTRADLRATLDGLGLHPVESVTRTILIVDDDPKTLEMCAAFLPPEAYSVVQAKGVASALDLARSVRPDLVLVELVMSGVSGVEVVEALRSDPLTERIPILVVTSANVTALERTAITDAPGQPIRIIPKAGFDRSSYVAEVRRALLPNQRKQPHGQNPDH